MSTKRQAQIKAKKEGVEYVDKTIPPCVVKDAKTHYVKNSELRAELIKSGELGELTDRAVDMFVQIATKLSSKLKYNDPADREDCISYAILDCLRYWRDYDPEYSENAFAYITSVCLNGFAKGWRALGKIKCPDSARIPISDGIYSI